MNIGKHIYMKLIMTKILKTDEEQKTLAKCFTLREIRESFQFIKNRNYEDTFINFNRYAKFRSK